MEGQSVKDIVKSIAEGLDPDRAGEAYGALDEAERTDVLAALKDLRIESAGTFLNLIFSFEESKHLKKEIRRLLFRLKSAGLKVEDPAPDGMPVLRKVEDIKLHRALLSNYDPMGTRVVILALELKRNLFAFFHGVTHFTEGLLELASGNLKRTELDRVLEEYGSFTKRPLSLVAISPSYAAFLLEESSVASGKHVDDVKQISRFVAALPDDVKTPEDVLRIPVDEPPDPLPPEEVLSEDLFEPLALPWPTKDSDRKAYDGLESSTIVLPGHMVQEKRETFLKDLLLRDDFHPIIAGTKRLLEDYAYMLYNLGRLAAYRGVVEALKNPEFPGMAVLFYVKRELDAKKEEAPQSGLIVSPYEQIRR